MKKKKEMDREEEVPVQLLCETREKNNKAGGVITSDLSASSSCRGTRKLSDSRENKIHQEGVELVLLNEA